MKYATRQRKAEENKQRLLTESGLTEQDLPDEVERIVIKRVSPFLNFPMSTWAIAKSCYLCGLIDGCQTKEPRSEKHKTTYIDWNT